MQREAKRRCPFRSAKQQRRGLQVMIARLAGPDRRQRDHMRKIERRQRRLTDIGIDMTRQAAEPGFDGIHALRHAGEVAALDDLLHQAQLLVGSRRVGVPDCDGRGDIGLADLIGAKVLQRRVGIDGLVVSIRIHEACRLAGHDLLQDRG